MKMYAIYFCTYSISGWVIDTAVRTMQAGELTAVNSLGGFPFSPMYGIGALGVLYLHRYIQQWPLIAQFFLYTVVLGTYEYVGGIFSEAVHGYKLWDYSHIPFNIHGHTNVFHSIAWGVLALIVVHCLHPRLQKMLETQTTQNTEEHENSAHRQ